MWTEWIFIGLLVLPCAVSTSQPKPIKVRFSSVNLRNVLHWLPGNDSLDTKFTVQYAVYGKPIKNAEGKSEIWRPVQECRKITRTWCDLSNETKAEEQGYFARVRAIGSQSSSTWVVTPRFDPKSETVFGAPEVSVEIENNSAIISLKGPMRYLSNTARLHPMKEVYPHMSYNLSIHNTHLNQVQYIPVVTSPYKYQLMEYNTKYCFSAKTRFLTIQMKSKSSVWHCITTPKDPVIEQLQSSLVGIVVPGLCICMFVVIGYILYHYLTGNDQKIPRTLKQPSFYPPPLKYATDITHLVTITEQPQFSKPLPVIDLNPPPIYTPPNPKDDLEGDYGSVSREGDGHEERDNQNITTCDHASPSAGVYAPQVNTCNCRSLAHAGHQLQTPEQTEAVSLIQMHLWPQVNTTLPLRPHAPVLSSQESVAGESSGLFISRNSFTGLFDLHLNLHKQKEAEEGRRTSGKEKGGQEERSSSENVPLLSGYAPWNITNVPPVQSDESDYSAEYSCVVIQPPAETAEQSESTNGREGGYVPISWSSETSQLELPQPEGGEEITGDSIFNGKWGLVLLNE
ncbi:interleukin-20 receptor subunit alpha [Nematolebias whitei]|uniref:interleukin-20 receptor subunit alpha n=1 Tax=Nematolebias whitei TaxID=451745 RepID=UPI00189C4520|nr:interleukin-20 receptor subunit alpha [Nematolebias whitei]